MAKNEALALAPDNYMEMCAIDDSLGARRYERFKGGKSLEEIAEEDGVKVDTVRMDVLAFEKKFELLTQNAIVRERLDGELENKGKYVTVTAVDYQMMLAGIKEFQKLVSLEQKPQVPTTVVNVNQTNNTQVNQGEDFEERMRRIKQQQKESIAAAEAAKVVDLEPIVEEEEEEEPQPEWDF